MADLTKAGIPGIPTAALNAIQDENARLVLQAIVDGLNVRNGATGNGNNRFVTASELGDLRGAVDGVSQLVTRQAAKNDAPLSAATIGRIIDDLQASVIESTLFKQLGERITLIDKNLIDGLIAEAQKRGAAITQEKTERQTADTSLASQITTVTAAVGQNAAAIQQEVTARANADNALTQTINTQIATVNGNLSALQQSQTTTANNVSALSQSVSTLQVTVGQNTSAIQQEALTRANKDGEIQSRYTIKIDTNGYVSGFGLIQEANNATPRSDFIIRADRFAIGNPSWFGNPIRVPFIVLTTTDDKGNPPGVYMDEAMIKNASIGTAKIDDASVNTLKIAGNAITQPVVISANGYQQVQTNTGNYTPVASISVDMGLSASGVMSLLFQFSYLPVNTSGGSWQSYYQITDQYGAVVLNGYGGVANNTSAGTVSSFGLVYAIPGINTFTLNVQNVGNINGASGVQDIRMMVLGAKR